jgi:hypothetical protein
MTGLEGPGITGSEGQTVMGLERDRGRDDLVRSG